MSGDSAFFTHLEVDLLLGNSEKVVFRKLGSRRGSKSLHFCRLKTFNEKHWVAFDFTARRVLKMNQLYYLIERDKSSFYEERERIVEVKLKRAV